MDPGNQQSLMVIFFIVGALLVGAVAFFSYLAAKKRREDLFLLAQELGLEYDQNDPYYIEVMYEFFSWIDQGHNRSAYNVLHGAMDDCIIKAFDYQYYTTSRSSKGSREERHSFSAIIADTKYSFQELHIGPESFFDRIGQAIGFADIDFESDEFSRAFCVKAPDKKFAYDMIHPRMMEFLMIDRRWSIEMKSNCIMIVIGTSEFTPEQIKDGIALLRQFMGLIPDYLKREMNFESSIRDTRSQ